MTVNLNASTRVQARQAGFGAALQTDLQRGGTDAAATLRQLRDYIHDSKGHLRAGDIRIVNTTNHKELAFSFKSFGWGQQYRKDRTAEALVTLLQRAGVANAQQQVDSVLKPNGAQAYGRLTAVALNQLLSSAAARSALDEHGAPQAPAAAQSLSAASVEDSRQDALLQQIRQLHGLLAGGLGGGVGPGSDPAAERLDANIRRAAGPDAAPLAAPLAAPIAAPVPAPAASAPPAAPALNPNLSPRQQTEAFLGAQGYQFPDAAQLGKGGFGATFLARHQGSDQVVKLFLKDEPGQPQAFAEATLTGKRSADVMSELYATYLTRSGSKPNWQPPKVIAPSAYLVRSARPEGFESIPVDQVKLRARQTRGGLKCVGLIMAKAPGEGMDQLIKRGGLSAQHLKQATLSGLQTLRSLNERGFIHRDIKPANVNFDPQSGDLHFFDTGALFKSRKSAQNAKVMADARRLLDLPVPRVGTRGYNSRDYYEGSRTSSQGDLHALALTLLQARFSHLDTSALLMAGRTRYIGAGDFRQRLETLAGAPHTQAGAQAATFLAEMSNPSSYAHFIMAALNKADSAQIPLAQWANRAVSDRHLQELMAHPALQ